MEDITNKAPRAKELTMMDRKTIFAMLLMHCNDGHIEHKHFVSVAGLFGGKVRRLQNLWRDTLRNMETYLSNHATDGVIFEELNPEDRPVCPFEGMVLLQERKLPLTLFPDEVYNSGKIGNVGAKRKFDREELKDRGAAVPYNRRNSYKHLGSELGISTSSAFRLLHEEKVFWVSSLALNPHLTDVNKEWRFQFCVDQIDERTLDLPTRSKPKFKNLFNEVHVDEKWFCLLY